METESNSSGRADARGDGHASPAAGAVRAVGTSVLLPKQVRRPPGPARAGWDPGQLVFSGGFLTTSFPFKKHTLSLHFGCEQNHKFKSSITIQGIMLREWRGA